jgi:hypothetical protein
MRYGWSQITLRSIRAPASPLGGGAGGANKCLLHRVKNAYLRNGHFAAPRRANQELIGA